LIRSASAIDVSPNVITTVLGPARKDTGDVGAPGSRSDPEASQITYGCR
jgi:hypothetical protein